MNPTKGEVWSVFVLKDDGTWEQPSYVIPRNMTEFELCHFAQADIGGFYACGPSPDPDCPEESARRDLCGRPRD